MHQPRTVTVNRSDYVVNTDFRNWLKFLSAFDDEQLTVIEQRAIQLRLCYADFDRIVKRFAMNIADFWSAALYFLRCGKPLDDKDTRRDPLFDFDEDWGYIVAAFKQQYDIDLNDENVFMHWWDFMAHFYSLSADTKIMQIISIRGTNLAEIKDKKERAKIREQQELYKLNKVRKLELADDADWAEFEKQLTERAEDNENV